MSRAALAAAAGLVAALAAGGDAAPAQPNRPAATALSSSTVCTVLASSTAERAAKLLLPKLPGSIRASALLPLVVGGAVEFCPDLAPKAVSTTKSLYRSLFGAPAATPAAADTVPPAVLGPGHGIPGGWHVGNDGTLPVKAYWLALDAGGLSRVRLIVLEDGRRREVAVAGAYSALATQVVRAGTTYQFGVRAVDRARNWREHFGLPFTPAVYDDAAARLSTGWKRVADSSHLDGSTITSGTPSAWARFTFTGSAVAVIAPRWTGGGSADVRIDDRSVGAAGFHADAFQPREVVYGWRFDTRSTHTIDVVQTSGQAALDGFVVLQ